MGNAQIPAANRRTAVFIKYQNASCFKLKKFFGMNNFKKRLKSFQSPNAAVFLLRIRRAQVQISAERPLA
jgi:hypothetical protein